MEDLREYLLKELTSTPSKERRIYKKTNWIAPDLRNELLKEIDEEGDNEEDEGRITIDIDNIDSFLSVGNSVDLFNIINQKYRIKRKYLLLDSSYAEIFNNTLTWYMSAGGTSDLNLKTPLRNVISLQILPTDLPTVPTYLTALNYMLISIEELNKYGYANNTIGKNFQFLFKTQLNADSDRLLLSNIDVDGNEFITPSPLDNLTSITINFYDIFGQEISYGSGISYEVQRMTFGQVTSLPYDYTEIYLSGELPALSSTFTFQNFTTTDPSTDSAIIATINSTTYTVTTREPASGYIRSSTLNILENSLSGDIVFGNGLSLTVTSGDSSFKIPIVISYVDSNIKF